MRHVPADKLPLEEGQTTEELCDLLAPVIFDPEVMPKRVNQTDGDDLVRTSACNYYGDGVTQTEAETFYNAMKQEGDPRPVMYGMNSRLVKADGKLQEKVWKSGGLYGAAIDRIIYWLEKAAGVAENGKQAEVLRKLIEFYRTGDLKTFDEYTILWVQETEAMVGLHQRFHGNLRRPVGAESQLGRIRQLQGLGSHGTYGKS